MENGNRDLEMQRPVVLRGTARHRVDSLLRRGRRIRQQLQSLNREQLLRILSTEGISRDLARINALRPQLQRLLQQQIAARGVGMEGPPADQVHHGVGNAAQQHPRPAPVPHPLDCASCRANPSTVVFKLCHHLCVCHHCFDALLQRNAPHAIPCPVCGQLHPQNQVVAVSFN